MGTTLLSHLVELGQLSCFQNAVRLRRKPQKNEQLPEHGSRISDQILKRQAMDLLIREIFSIGVDSFVVTGTTDQQAGGSTIGKNSLKCHIVRASSFDVAPLRHEPIKRMTHDIDDFHSWKVSMHQPRSIPKFPQRAGIHCARLTAPGKARSGPEEAPIPRPALTVMAPKKLRLFRTADENIGMAGEHGCKCRRGRLGGTDDDEIRQVSPAHSHLSGV